MNIQCDSVIHFPLNSILIYTGVGNFTKCGGKPYSATEALGGKQWMHTYVRIICVQNLHALYVIVT